MAEMLQNHEVCRHGSGGAQRIRGQFSEFTPICDSVIPALECVIAPTLITFFIIGVFPFIRSRR